MSTATWQSFENRLTAALTARERPNILDWFCFPPNEDGDKLLFEVSDITAHIFILHSEYAACYVSSFLYQIPPPDERESRIINDIWMNHLKGILEHFFGREIDDSELILYEMRSGWNIVKTNLPKKKL